MAGINCRNEVLPADQNVAARPTPDAESVEFDAILDIVGQLLNPECSLGKSRDGDDALGGDSVGKSGCARLRCAYFTRGGGWFASAKNIEKRHGVLLEISFSLSFFKKPWIQKGCGVLSKIYSQNQSTMYVF
jgi:hypothetical protein